MASHVRTFTASRPICCTRSTTCTRGILHSTLCPSRITQHHCVPMAASPNSSASEAPSLVPRSVPWALRLMAPGCRKGSSCDRQTCPSCVQTEVLRWSSPLCCGQRTTALAAIHIRCTDYSTSMRMRQIWIACACRHAPARALCVSCELLLLILAPCHSLGRTDI